MSLAFKTLAVTAAATLLATGTAAAAPPLPKPGQEKPTFRTVPTSLFGMHDHGLSDGPVADGVRFGAVRIWDNGVRWDQVNPEEGVYNWDLLDSVVANSRAAGAQQVMYVLGYTPNWAAKTIQPPCTPGTYTDCSYYPTGSGSPPKSMDIWRTWVAAVAERYKGQITEYQIWNEANLTSFFDTPGENSPQVMAQLTLAAEQVIRQVDPSARVVTASSTVVQKKNFVSKGWLRQYLTALKKLGGNPDVIAFHAYPWLNKGPGNGDLEDRAKGVDMAMQAIAKSGYKNKLVADTEMNYGNQRNNGWPKKKYSESAGSAYLAQTYINSLYNGLSQVDWYGWDDYGLGVWTTSKSGQILAPGRTYEALLQKMPGSRNKGCTVSKQVTVCLTTRGSQKTYYAYRMTSKKVTFTVPKSFGVSKACDIFDNCKPIRKAKLKVGLDPVLLTK